mmetsp:Transcript_5793/g.15704  ORF Transcript_5793/g.15704 Transcript_5793/m.15704 type:complete len:188 (-) Transcript_5793:199-762(-)
MGKSIPSAAGVAVASGLGTIVLLYASMRWRNGSNPSVGSGSDRSGKTNGNGSGRGYPHSNHDNSDDNSDDNDDDSFDWENDPREQRRRHNGESHEQRYPWEPIATHQSAMSDYSYTFRQRQEQKQIATGPAGISGRAHMPTLSQPADTVDKSIVDQAKEIQAEFEFMSSMTFANRPALRPPSCPCCI